MEYELFSIGNGITLVSYLNGNIDIMSDKELAELQKKPKKKDKNILFNNLITKMIEEYSESKENHTSKFNERVIIRLINERVKWSKDGVCFSGEYELVGCDSGEVKDFHKVEVEKLVPTWKNINLIYRSLLQLWSSGCHATIEDEHNFRQAMGRRH